MVVWLSIMTLVLGGLAAQFAATDRPRAAVIAALFGALYHVQWWLYVFRGAW